MTVSSNLLAYGLIVVLTPALIFGLRWIFSLDRDDEPKQGAVVIPVRAIGRTVEIISAVAGSFSIVAGLLKFLAGNGNGVWGILFGFGFSLFGSYVTNSHLWLDELGMHYRSGFGKPRIIEWRNLDHYEQTIVRGQTVATRYFLFHSRDGSTTFWISKTNYDIDKLLDSIRSHVSIDERPYVNH